MPKASGRPPLSKAVKAMLSSVGKPDTRRYGDNGMGRTGLRKTPPITLPHAEALARHGIGVATKETSKEDEHV